MNLKIIKENQLINVQVFDSVEHAQKCYPDCEFIDALLSEEEYFAQIDGFIQTKIREKYSASDEYKMLRLGATDNTNIKFIEYNSYIEECVNRGKLEKQKYFIGSEE